jgi:hypothetical protein
LSPASCWCLALASSLPLKMEAVRYSETSVGFNQTTRRYISEDSALSVTPEVDSVVRNMHTCLLLYVLTISQNSSFRILRHIPRPVVTVRQMTWKLQRTRAASPPPPLDFFKKIKFEEGSKHNKHEYKKLKLFKCGTIYVSVLGPATLGR